jgi:hypothetical protein
MTAILGPFGWAIIAFRSVVFPAPRKPVSRVTGKRVTFVAVVLLILL